MWGEAPMETETNAWGTEATTDAWGGGSGIAQTENGWNGGGDAQNENKPKGKGRGKKGPKESKEAPESPPPEKYKPTMSAGWFRYKKDKRTPLSNLVPENAEVIEIVDDEVTVLDDQAQGQSQNPKTTSTTFNVKLNLHYFEPKSLEDVPVKIF
jgi:hypothetical protein